MLKGRSIIFIAFLLFIWELIIRVADIPHWLLPAPSAIMIEGIESYSTFIPHVWATIQLALLGLAIGVMCGLRRYNNARSGQYFDTKHKIILRFIKTRQKQPHLERVIVSVWLFPMFCSIVF
ncbi:hypothetical protein LSPH26S_02454 [Lysinibacillus sphaericus]